MTTEICVRKYKSNIEGVIVSGVITEIKYQVVNIGIGTATNAATLDVTYIAGETLNGNRIVYVENDGFAYLADSTDISHFGKVVGMTTGAAMTGDVSTIRRAGKIQNAGWSLTVNELYFFNTIGQPTLTPPPTGFVQSIGIAVTTDTIDLRLSEPIAR